MTKLALKGHPKRGKEVIQLLEMLGADRLGYKDTFVGFYYYIECDAIVSSDKCPIDAIVFTLEEFEKLYPYKVGDKVIFGDIDNIVWEIESMQWVNNEIKYIIRDNNKSRLCDIKAEHLQSYKEETNMKEIKSIDLNKLEQQLNEALAKETPESLNKWLDEENMEKRLEPVYELVTGKILYYEEKVSGEKYCPIGETTLYIQEGYEFRDETNNVINAKKITLTRKQSQYPKTYEECCQHLGCDDKLNVGELIPFQQLVNARNAYWKIAGEQMGLRKPWGPDWRNYEEQKYCIKTDKGEITLSEAVTGNKILAFPTKEMRNAFYENFKELIEDCKSLL